MRRAAAAGGRAACAVQLRTALASADCRGQNAECSAHRSGSDESE